MRDKTKIPLSAPALPSCFLPLVCRPLSLEMAGSQHLAGLAHTVLVEGIGDVDDAVELDLLYL